MTATTEVACSSSKVADLTTSGSGCDSAQLLPSNEATAASAEIDKSLDPLLGLGMADDHNAKSNDKTEAAQQDSGSIEPPASVVKFNRESIGGNDPLQAKQISSSGKARTHGDAMRDSVVHEELTVSAPVITNISENMNLRMPSSRDELEHEPVLNRFAGATDTGDAKDEAQTCREEAFQCRRHVPAAEVMTDQSGRSGAEAEKIERHRHNHESAAEVVEPDLPSKQDITEAFVNEDIESTGIPAQPSTEDVTSSAETLEKEDMLRLINRTVLADYFFSFTALVVSVFLAQADPVLSIAFVAGVAGWLWTLPREDLIMELGLEAALTVTGLTQGVWVAACVAAMAMLRVIHRFAKEAVQYVHSWRSSDGYISGGNGDCVQAFTWPYGRTSPHEQLG
ncbi:hypothetical protein IEO21_07510 [Rhodonia placenta]|uniref:Transmembrane protein n=1 Tax=Rhodonia placenta TaxID=104341 RepID=A0A8H7NXW2_9APHY|nr:hypothetical protein IEO21_07510 [Postia placenta]